jgi:hypothetical protein
MNIKDIDMKLAVLYGKQQDEMDIIKSEEETDSEEIIKSKINEK